MKKKTIESIVVTGIVFLALFFGIQEARASVVLEEHPSGYEEGAEIKSDQEAGQTFLYDSVPGTIDIDQVSVYMKEESGADAQTITVQIRSVSWGGDVECSGNFSSDTLGESYAFKDVSLSGCPSLAVNTTYWIRVTSNESSGKIWIGFDKSDSYANGDFLDKDGNAQEWDALFKVWGKFNALLTNVSNSPSPNTISDSSTHTVAFTTSGALPANGKIVVTFPAGFNLTAVGDSDISSGTMDGSFTVSRSGQELTITRSGGGSEPAAAENVIIADITNTATVGTGYTVTVETRDSGDIHHQRPHRLERLYHQRQIRPGKPGYPGNRSTGRHIRHPADRCGPGGIQDYTDRREFDLDRPGGEPDLRRRHGRCRYHQCRNLRRQRHRGHVR